MNAARPALRADSDAGTESAPLPVVFSHANSFALPTYRLLFSLLAERGIAAQGVERFLSLIHI